MGGGLLQFSFAYLSASEFWEDRLDSFLPPLSRLLDIVLDTTRDTRITRQVAVAVAMVVRRRNGFDHTDGIFPTRRVIKPTADTICPRCIPTTPVNGMKLSSFLFCQEQEDAALASDFAPTSAGQSQRSIFFNWQKHPARTLRHNWQVVLSFTEPRRIFCCRERCRTQV